MGLAKLFEFRAKAFSKGEDLAGMTEEEFEEKASLAVLKLRSFCRKLKGYFRAHSPYSATCWLPEPTDVSLVRVGKGVIGAIPERRPYVEIFFEEVPEVFEVKVDEGVVVDISSEPLESADYAKLASGGGEIHNLKVKSISIRTDPTEKHVHVDLL